MNEREVIKDQLTLSLSLCILLPGYAHVTLRRRRLPPGICDEKVGPFSAHKTASGNLCPKGWPFLATDAFGAVLKCNCYSFWPGIWTYKWVFISNVCLFMGLWTFLWLQAFAKSKSFSFWKTLNIWTFTKCEYLSRMERREERGSGTSRTSGTRRGASSVVLVSRTRIVHILAQHILR